MVQTFGSNKISGFNNENTYKQYYLVVDDDLITDFYRILPLLPQLHWLSKKSDRNSDNTLEFFMEFTWKWRSHCFMKKDKVKIQGSRTIHNTTRFRIFSFILANRTNDLRFYQQYLLFYEILVEKNMYWYFIKLYLIWSEIAL